MKLRCTTGSIRIRVQRSDIEALRKYGMKSEIIHLPDGNAFGFSLMISKNEKDHPIAVDFEDFMVEVFLPAKSAGEWMDSEQVGMEDSLNLPDGSKLVVLVEKDFPCHHNPAANPGETFGELVPPKS